MAFRSVRISRPADLSIKHHQLRIVQEEQVVTIPLEDIATITLEDPAIRLSVHVLREAAEQGIVILSCNQKHTPSGIFQSFYSHSRQLTVLHRQLEMSKPYQKRCWQAIVRSKIMNQVICCELIGETAVADQLRSICSSVGSGDPTNREAYAARLYFAGIFDKTFKRRQANDWRNAALNYGYAIIRAGVARAISEYGFIPALGIHHKSELNTFNLADDFFEPFRPLVDLFIMERIQQAEFNNELLEELTPLLKKELTELLHYSIKINQEECSVLHAIDLMVKSFVTASEAADSERLLLPELIPLRRHTYE